MCGRYTQTKKLEELQRRFSVVIQKVLALIKPSFNQAPGQNASVIVQEEEAELEAMRWGLVPSWAKEANVGYKMINARSETVLEKPAYKRLVARKRCLVPADGFFEWRKNPGTKTKTPFYFSMQDRSLFAFAGLWDHWMMPDQTVLRSFTVLTTQANELVAPVHDRMPVILPREREGQWLDPDFQVKECMDAFLQPLPASLMQAYPVSSAVNSPGTNDESCIKEVADRLPRQTDMLL